MGKLTSRVPSRKPTRKYGLPVLVFNSSLTVINRNRSASWPGDIWERVTMGMVRGIEKKD